MGVVLYHGDMTDAKAVEKVMDGADAMVLLTTSLKFKQGTNLDPKKAKWVRGLQVEQARTVIRSAIKNELQIVVYMSVVGTEYVLEKYKSAEMYNKKWNRSIIYGEKLIIEDMVKASGMMWTIIQTPMVMELLASANQGITKKGKFPSAYKRTASVGLISCEDIGKLAKMALYNPDDWDKQYFTPMTDKLTPIEQCEILAQARGEIGLWDVTCTPRPLLFMMKPHWARTLDTAEEIFEKVDHGAAIRATKKVLPEAVNLREWYQKKGLLGNMDWTEPSCVVS